MRAESLEGEVCREVAVRVAVQTGIQFDWLSDVTKRFFSVQGEYDVFGFKSLESVRCPGGISFGDEMSGHANKRFPKRLFSRYSKFFKRSEFS